MKPNQDAVTVSTHARSGARLLAVFDGHGELGHEVSRIFADNVARLVFGHPLFLSPHADVVGALVATLAALEERAIAEFDCTLSGSTGCVAVVLEDTIYVANVGDSRAILVRRTPPPSVSTFGAGHVWSVVPLTTDHAPECAKERARIERAGGCVRAIQYDTFVGPLRIWRSDAESPGLAMTRSFGDLDGKRAGIIATPQISVHHRAADDAFLLLATDGLFAFTTNERVCDILVYEVCRVCACA